MLGEVIEPGRLNSYIECEGSGGILGVTPTTASSNAQSNDNVPCIIDQEIQSMNSDSDVPVDGPASIGCVVQPRDYIEPEPEQPTKKGTKRKATSTGTQKKKADNTRLVKKQVRTYMYLYYITRLSFCLPARVSVPTPYPSRNTQCFYL